MSKEVTFEAIAVLLDGVDGAEDLLNELAKLNGLTGK